jgi:hypothetical protein
VDEISKHQLEGLLKARCDDLRHVRRRLPPRDEPGAGASLPAAGAAPIDIPAPARTCAGCAGAIGVRRLRAMPTATRCLGCQRAAEAATART